MGWIVVWENGTPYLQDGSGKHELPAPVYDILVDVGALDEASWQRVVGLLHQTMEDSTQVPEDDDYEDCTHELSELGHRLRSTILEPMKAYLDALETMPRDEEARRKAVRATMDVLARLESMIDDLP